MIRSIRVEASEDSVSQEILFGDSAVAMVTRESWLCGLALVPGRCCPHVLAAPWRSQKVRDWMSNRKVLLLDLAASSLALPLA